MKKFIFLGSVFISTFLHAELSPQYQEVYKEAHKIFAWGNYVGAIQLCTPIIEHPDTPKKDLLYFLLARSHFYLGRPGEFEDRKTVEKLIKEYPEVKAEYEEIINPENYLYLITKE